MTYFLQKVAKKIILVFFTLIITLLTLLSIIGTCYIDIREHMHYTYINVTDFIGFVCIMCILFFAVKKLKKKMIGKLSISHLLFFSFILGIVYILVAQFEPRADQNLCLLFAQQMHEGDFSAFMPKGYMQIYPQQTGLVLVYYLLGFIIGTRNIIFIQFLNVLGYTAFIYCIYAITKKLFQSERLAKLVAVFTILFLPLLFFTAFVYGTMLGLAASSYAILKAMEYMETRRGKDGLICALFCGISILMKKNYIIVVVAIVVVLFLNIIIRNHKKAILCIALIVASYLFFTKVPLAVTEQITGQPMDSGLPSIAWVTMGMQDGAHRANGWYNSYSLNTYQDNDCDAAKTAAIAKKDLIKYLKKFAKHPGRAAGFFLGKLASEWNEPTFQCFFVNDVSSITKESSPFAYALTRGVGQPVLVKYMDFLLTFVYLGTFLYLLHDRKNLTLWHSIPIIAFVGGFLFHTAWEAKGQYTLNYFVLLFPYCFKGYREGFYQLERAIRNRRALSRNEACRALAPVLIVTITFTLFTAVDLFVPIVNVNVKKENKKYQTYLVSPPTTKFFVNGYYRIKDLVTDEYVTFNSSDPDYSLTASFCKEKTDSQVLSVVTTRKEMNISIKKYSQPLNNVSMTKVDNALSKRRINLYCLSNMVSWSILVAPDGSYVFKNSLNYALTRTKDKKIVLKPYDSKNKKQRWALEEV